jgi:hypothetical protein
MIALDEHGNLFLERTQLLEWRLKCMVEWEILPLLEQDFL